MSPYFVSGPQYTKRNVTHTHKHTHTTHRPLLIDRFPLEDNQETRVENGVADFCFPTGLRLARGMQMPRFFSFVLTNGEGDRSYGHTLVIYELLPEEAEARLTTQIQEWELREEEERRRREGETPPLKRETGRTGAFFAEEEEEEEASGHSDGEAAPENLSVRPSTSTDPSFPSSTSPSSPSDLERIFAPKCLCLLSKYPFVDASRAWLLQLYRLSCSPTPVPLERYICNFLLEVPCPVPGRVDIQYSMLDQVIHYPCPPPHQPLAWSGGLPLEAVLEWLGPENLLTVFNAVLLEQQVLLHSTQFSLLTAVAEFLTACMWPLTYSHVFIPILPRQCLYLCANSPVPFLLGCHTESFKLVADQLPDTVTVVDLDRNDVRLAPGVPLPPLPGRRKSKLLRVIKDHANLFERAEQRHQVQQQQQQRQQQGLEASAAPPPLPPLPPHIPASTSLPTTMAATAAATLLPTSPPSMSQPQSAPPAPPSPVLTPALAPTTLPVASSLPPPPPPMLPRALSVLDDPFSQAGRFLHQGGAGEAGAMNEEDWDALRDAFLGFFLALLKDYRKYLTFPTNEDPKLKLGFKQADFVASHPSEWASFLEEFCRTQALQSFLDARLQPDPEDSGEVAFFDELIEARQKGKPRFSMGGIGGGRRQPSFRRPAHLLRQQQEVKTLVALQPDVSSLPSEPFVYGGFPVLQDKWYVPPRPVNDLAAGAVEDDGATLCRRRGRRRRGIKKRNHILRFKSDHIPWNPATLVFSTFLMAFSLTIGRDLQQQPDVAAAGKTQRDPEAEAVKSAASPPPLSRLDLASGISEPSTGSVGSVEGEEDMKDREEEEEQDGTAQEQGNQGSVTGSARSGSTLRRSSSASSFRLRPRMRRLSEDMKEERVHAATCKLTLAFEVLQRMHAQRTAADEWIYRCLIDSSSRLGSVDMALRALTEMNEAGFAVDASVVSTLLSGAASSQASQALSMLDWNKIRRGGLGPGGAGGGGHHSQKSSVKMSGGTPKVFKDALSAFRKMGTPGSSSFWSLSTGGNHHQAVGKGGSSSSGISSPNASRHGSLDRQSTAGASGLADSRVLPFDLVLDESAKRDAEAMGRAKSVKPAADLTGGTGPAETTASRASSSSTSSDMAAYNTPLITYQVLYGESLLGMLFPNLVLDVNAETCPECNARLSSAQIQSGWLPDPNNYTTSCPLCLVAREAKLKEQQQFLQQQQQQQGMNHLLDFNVDRDRRSSVLLRPPPPPPLRRFVARFSVHCTAPDWVGSTGPGTPLWCEYLSPWVLRKEVQTILLNDGIESLLSPQFRKAHTASSTIWWNLILWCRDFALPIAFLLQDSVEGAASAPFF